jgi:hypothetical protein
MKSSQSGKSRATPEELKVRRCVRQVVALLTHEDEGVRLHTLRVLKQTGLGAMLDRIGDALDRFARRHDGALRQRAEVARVVVRDLALFARVRESRSGLTGAENGACRK